MIKLSKKWAPRLLAQGESGMGYQIATIILHNGEQFLHVVIVGDLIKETANQQQIPFREEDIADIVVTHDK